MPTTPLEPDAAERQRLMDQVAAFTSRFIDEHAAGTPDAGPIDDELAHRLLASPPEQGRDLGQLLDTLLAAAAPGHDTASGRFLGYIPSGGLFTGALGMFLGATMNQYTGGAHAAPGLVAIEESVLRFIAGDVLGMPDGAGGVTLSGGSMANLTAVVAARARFARAEPDGSFGAGVVYTSARAHHSVAKACRIAGIADGRVRLVPTDEVMRMDVQALRAAIAEDAEGGLRPLMIVATAGTTDTGAIDPLDGCADVAAADGAWLHVDAAVGGFFGLTDRGRARLAGIGRADSVTVDAHKSLFMPYGLAALLVRDPAALVDAHEGGGAYMRDILDVDLPHYMMRGPELTRPSRGVPLWLALHVHGVSAFRDELDRMLDLTEHAAERLRGMDGVHLVDEPGLCVLAFRADRDVQTEQALAHINASGQVWVSSTEVAGRPHVRLALLSQRTTTAHVDAAVDLVAESLAAGRSATG